MQVLRRECSKATMGVKRCTLRGEPVASAATDPTDQRGPPVYSLNCAATAVNQHSLSTPHCLDPVTEIVTVGL